LDKLLDEIQSNLTILENLAHGAEDRKTLAALDAQQVQATNEERLELAEACSKDVAFKKALEEYAGSHKQIPHLRQFSELPRPGYRRTPSEGFAGESQLQRRAFWG